MNETKQYWYLVYYKNMKKSKTMKKRFHTVSGWLTIFALALSYQLFIFHIIMTILAEPQGSTNGNHILVNHQNIFFFESILGYIWKTKQKNNIPFHFVCTLSNKEALCIKLNAMGPFWIDNDSIAAVAWFMWYFDCQKEKLQLYET